ncbi:MAG: hypothetical protein Q8Q23_01200 [bacterium]|nr:hypothetical protein [bacterium]
MKLNDIINSQTHWVFPAEKNPLTREKIREMCRQYGGNGSFQSFKEYMKDVIEERSGVIIDSNLIYEIFQRREEFANGEVEGP